MIIYADLCIMTCGRNNKLCVFFKICWQHIFTFCNIYRELKVFFYFTVNIEVVFFLYIFSGSSGHLSFVDAQNKKVVGYSRKG